MVFLTMVEHFVFNISGRVTPKARPRINGKKAYLPSNYRLWRSVALIELYKQPKPVIPLKSASIGIQFFVVIEATLIIWLELFSMHWLRLRLFWMIVFQWLINFQSATFLLKTHSVRLP